MAPRRVSRGEGFLYLCVFVAYGWCAVGCAGCRNQDEIIEEDGYHEVRTYRIGGASGNGALDGGFRARAGDEATDKTTYRRKFILERI